MQTNRRNRWRASAMLSMLFSCLPVRADVVNGSFEVPSVGTGNFQYQPSLASWSFVGGAGISNVNSAFTSGAPEVPGGQQVGFLQGVSSMQQSVYLVPNSILSFQATQRVNYSDIQTLQVLVSGTPQAFILGTKNGVHVSTTSITPPTDYYESYAVKLASVPRAGYYTVSLAGTNGVGDATAFVDAVAISTPNNHAYGFWDQGIANGTWRSDYATSTNVPTYGPCLFTAWNYAYTPTNPNVEPNAIVTGGGTPYGATPPNPTPCFGNSGQYVYPSYPNSTWTSSSGYVTGSPHWIVDVNYEILQPVAGSDCPQVGPPNESRFILTPGTPGGPSISIDQATVQSDPAIGNYNVVSLISNDIANDNGHGCLPYLGYGVSSAHGNVKPIAIMDAASNYRPKLSFKESVFGADGQSVANAWLFLSLSGWNDNYKRMISISLGSSSAMSAYFNQNPQDFWMNSWFNWNTKNSYYYPGGIIRFITTQQLNSECGLNLPTLSFANTYTGSNGSPSSISSYNIDLYSLVRCAASTTDFNGAYPWFNPSGVTQLPDPIVVSQLNWTLEEDFEGTETPPQNWLAFWNPMIN